MATAAGEREKPQSSNPLDNFSFPILKRWGNQRMLRCANVNRKGEIIEGDRRPSLPAAASERRALPDGARIRVPVEDSEDGDGGSDDGGLEELRAKLMGHLREAADWIKIGALPPLLGRKAEGDVPVPVPVQAPAPAPAREMEAGLAPEPEPSSSAAEAERPWNLRTRRAACKGPIGTGGRQPSSSTAPAAAAAERGGRERTVRLRSESAGKRERPKLSVALTPEEIEEDIYAVTGSRPRRRPKKRPRIVQKQLDSLFPGLWLSEITADLYKVPDD
ncbi:uncharacterized protein LOC103713963 [Phoenix dactylifera]|uniref:Uncharacterized protein LOC103713963 n=1 Tax=Phoenix dactylifera TaxID=42345 RepID=A0A8B7CHD8_PHODC|nr:uncharacterized protein LOC103713963 [Phoenix dactylifera]